MEILVIRLAAQRVNSNELTLLVDDLLNLANFIDSGLAYPERFAELALPLNNVTLQPQVFCTRLKAFFDTHHQLDHWLILASMAYLKLIVDQMKGIHLDQCLPQEWKPLGQVIDASLVVFETQWEKVDAAFLRDSLDRSDDIRICALACLFCAFRANVDIPQNTVRLVSEMKLQSLPFDVGLLAVCVLKVGGLKLDSKDLEEDRYLQLLDMMELMGGFSYL
jgi:hypothetical protein